MKLLIRVPNWIGDSVLARPAIEAIAANFPDAEIWLNAAAWVQELFAADGKSAGIVPVPRSNDIKAVREAAKKIKCYGFDIGILLTNSFGSALLFSLAGIPERWGYATDGRKLLLTRSVQDRNRDKPRHQVQYYLDLVSGLGLKTHPPELRLTVSEEEKKRARRLLEDEGVRPGQPFVVLSPGAAYGPAKRWPAFRFAALAALFQDRRDAAVAVIGSADESAIAADIAASFRKKTIDLTGKTTLRELMGFISLAHLFVSNDSGPMHLANALHIPVVGIFGPTDPAVTGPFEQPSVVVKKSVPCWPCSYRACPYDHRCMTAIQPEDVYRAGESIWR